MFFKKKRTYQDYFNQGYLKAVFAPKKELDALQKQYSKQKATPTNQMKLKALMAGFMAGLEARNKSRLHLLEKTSKMAREQEHDEPER